MPTKRDDERSGRGQNDLGAGRQQKEEQMSESKPRGAQPKGGETSGKAQRGSSDQKGSQQKSTGGSERSGNAIYDESEQTHRADLRDDEQESEGRELRGSNSPSAKPRGEGRH